MEIMNFYECVVAIMLPQIPVQATHVTPQCARLIFFMGFHFPGAKQKSCKQDVQFRDWDFFNFSELLTTDMQKLSELTHVTLCFLFCGLIFMASNECFGFFRVVDYKSSVVLST